MTTQPQKIYIIGRHESEEEFANGKQNTINQLLDTLLYNTLLNAVIVKIAQQ